MCNFETWCTILNLLQNYIFNKFYTLYILEKFAFDLNWDGIALYIIVKRSLMNIITSEIRIGKPKAWKTYDTTPCMYVRLNSQEGGFSVYAGSHFPLPPQTYFVRMSWLESMMVLPLQKVIHTRVNSVSHPLHAR